MSHPVLNVRPLGDVIRCFTPSAAYDVPTVALAGLAHTILRPGTATVTPNGGHALVTVRPRGRLPLTFHAYKA